MARVHHCQYPLIQEMARLDRFSLMMKEIEKSSTTMRSIDYDAGVITINDINITDVSSSDGLIRVTIGSESGIIESVRNNIVAIDIEDL